MGRHVRLHVRPHGHHSGRMQHHSGRTQAHGQRRRRLLLLLLRLLLLLLLLLLGCRLLLLLSRQGRAGGCGWALITAVSRSQFLLRRNSKKRVKLGTTLKKISTHKSYQMGWSDLPEQMGLHLFEQTGMMNPLLTR